MPTWSNNCCLILKQKLKCYCFSSFVSVAPRDNGGKNNLNEYSQGKFVHFSSDHFGSPQGFHAPGSDLPHCRFSSSWKEAATSHWVGHCLGCTCFSNIFFAASLNLFACHRFEKWLHTGKDWSSLWNRNGDKHQRSWGCGRAFRVWHAAVKRWLWADPVCWRAQKPAPFHCHRPVQKNKIQVSECSIYLPSTDPIGKELKKTPLYLLPFHALVLIFLVQFSELPGAGHPLAGWTVSSLIFRGRDHSAPCSVFHGHRRLSRKLQKYYFIVDFDAETNQECMSNELMV